jgi:hypothetical protein
MQQAGLLHLTSAILSIITSQKTYRLRLSLAFIIFLPVKLTAIVFLIASRALHL